MSKLKFGLDIGTSETRIVACGISNNKLKIKGYMKFSTKGYSAGSIKDLIQLSSLLSECFNKFSASFGIYPQNLMVNYTNPDIKFLKIKNSFSISNPDRRLDAKSIQKIINDTLLTRLSYEEYPIYKEVQEFILDGQKGITNPEGLQARKLEVILNVVVTNIYSYQNYIQAINNAGIEIGDIIIDNLALGYLVTTQEERESGILVIDIGYGMVKISYFYENRLLYYNCFPTNFTKMYENIEEKYHLMPQEAMAVMDKALLTESKEFLFPSKLQIEKIESVFVKSMIEKQLKRIFYKIKKKISENILNTISQGIVVTGRIFVECPEIVSSLEKIIRRPIRITSPSIEILPEDFGSNFEYLNALSLIYYNYCREKECEGLKKFNFLKKFKKIFDYF
jgi:cell division protein FtsA